MRKELPLLNTLTETYQGTSFVLGIIQAYDHVKNSYYNHYHQLTCTDTNDIAGITLEFDRSLWGDYRMEGVAEMNLFHYCNLHKDYFVKFIKERIDQDTYLLCYQIDEYYLSFTAFYKKMHHTHDIYIYGYDEEKETFLVHAYRKGKLSRLDVPYQEVIDCMYEHEDFNNGASFCTFRPNIAARCEVDAFKMIDDYEKYFYPEFETEREYGKIYGMQCYEVIERSLQILKKQENVNTYSIDLRSFRLLWEHKKIMKEHFEKLVELGCLNQDAVNTVSELEKLSLLCFNLMIKYSVSSRTSVLDKVLCHLNELKEMEKQLGESLWFDGNVAIVS